MTSWLRLVNSEMDPKGSSAKNLGLTSSGLRSVAVRAAGISGRAERKGLVSSIEPKLERLRLDAASCDQFRQQIVRRSGWRCQSCGAMSNLEVTQRLSQPLRR
jgi:hypothetical protein